MIRDEIEKHSSEIDKPILLFLLTKYSMASRWFFVARCRHKRYGTQSYETVRIWEPTEEGRIIYDHFEGDENGKIQI